jgi:hypothetical protein
MATSPRQSSRRRRFRRCQPTPTAMSTPMPVSTRSRLARGWRVISPPLPGTAGFAGRNSQTITIVPRTIPAHTTTAVTISRRLRARGNGRLVREGLIASAPAR